MDTLEVPEFQPVFTQAQIDEFVRLWNDEIIPAIQDVCRALAEAWETYIVPLLKDICEWAIIFHSYLKRSRLQGIILSYWPSIPRWFLRWLTDIWPDRFLPALI